MEVDYSGERLIVLVPTQELAASRVGREQYVLHGSEKCCNHLQYIRIALVGVIEAWGVD
jgi:hypothetical protein